MALVRILVDGYSLLHNWPELAPGRARHSEQARDALVQILGKYHDATGEPITVFFDGAGAPAGVRKNESRREVEVLFSAAGQTADEMIERGRFRRTGHGRRIGRVRRQLRQFHQDDRPGVERPFGRIKKPQSCRAKSF
jgi:predicted RNA-binding protein with PIN domain